MTRNITSQIDRRSRYDAKITYNLADGTPQEIPSPRIEQAIRQYDMRTNRPEYSNLTLIVLSAAVTAQQATA